MKLGGRECLLCPSTSSAVLQLLPLQQPEVWPHSRQDQAGLQLTYAKDEGGTEQRRKQRVLEWHLVLKILKSQLDYTLDMK